LKLEDHAFSKVVLRFEISVLLNAESERRVVLETSKVYAMLVDRDIEGATEEYIASRDGIDA
jgi:hypothetical protein